MELRAANGDLNDKVTQLEAARREASEAKVLLKTARREAFLSREFGGKAE